MVIGSATKDEDPKYTPLGHYPLRLGADQV